MGRASIVAKPLMESKVIAMDSAQIYQENQCILHNVSFEIDKGDFVYLVGRTGSGKSSLLKVLYADLPLLEGHAFVSGVSLKNIKPTQVPFLRRKIGVIFQDFQLLYDRNVFENLRFVLRATGWRASASIKQRIAEVLMQVGLGSMGTKMPHQLSGGEQQRLAIARALLNEPLILLADEPTGNLDPEVSEGILELFQSINSAGTAVFMATHNHTFLERTPARVLQCKGSILLDSKVEAITLENGTILPSV